ncbi:phage tail protein, partial [Escherichia coli]
SKANLTFRHVGAIGNGVEFELAKDEPNALASANATIVGLTGGTGVPDVAAALPSLGDDEFDFIAAPYADANSLNAVRDFMS